MQMTPARDLACEAGRLVIVNLQKTEKDSEAWMVLRGKIDDVMYGIMKKLELRIPVGRDREEATLDTISCLSFVGRAENGIGRR